VLGGVSPPDFTEILEYIYKFKNRLNYCARGEERRKRRRQAKKNY
jgi:hypothetical protein